MIKFFKKLVSLPFRKISKNVKKTNLRPEKNRKHVGKSLFFLAIALFAIFIFRFVWLITTNHIGDVNLKQMAESNYQGTETVLAKRGTIYDRNGIPIAVDASTYTIYVVLDKNQVDSNGNKLYADKAEFSKLEDFLNSQLGIDRTLISTQLNSGLKQVQFGTKGSNISLQKMQEIQKAADEQKLVGIGFLSNLSRSYPLGNFASEFIGIASPQNVDGTQELVGQMGLEAAFNNILSGSNGEETYQKDIYGRQIPGSIKTIKPVENGQDVYTTLSAPLQENLETLMDAAAEQSGAQQLSASLVDAHTGEILATSQRPTYTPTTVNTASKQPYFTWNSLLSQTAFEPGSTMKTFLMASALDSNKVDLNQTYQRSLDVYGTKINDWDVTESENHTYTLPQTVTFAQGFAMSSNIGMSKIEMNMGNSLWDSYLKKFKFGTRTRAGLFGEQSGSLPAANAVSQIQSSFGQGIGVTQIQLLRGWTAIAGNGTMLEPHIVSKVVNNNNNTVLQSEPEVVGHPVSSGAASEVRNLMLTVNTDPEFGTAYSPTGDPDENIPPGPLMVVNGQPAAVKTGTAQIAAPTGGYMTGFQEYLYSAVVMYPAQNPDFIFYMNVKCPTKSWTLKYIARVANPMITRAEALKDQLDTPTTNPTDKAGKVTISDYKNAAAGTTADELRRTVLDPVIIGSGSKITAQSIEAGDKVGANTRILLLTDGAEVMPDIYDWTKSEVEQLADWYGLKVTYEGSGNQVVGQSLGAVTNIKKGQSLTVTLGSG